MGLDVALGAIVLLGALRGWFRGFTTQAVRLISLVTCVYLALPVREQVRPYILAKLPAIDPALLDRMLWWVAAILSYLVLVGLISLAIQLMKSPPDPKAESSHRGDRLGGLLLGAAKAAVIAACLAAGIQKYGAELVHNVPWLDRQVVGSHALAWTVQYQPVPRMWSTAPVQSFVQQIQRHGLKHAPEGTQEKRLAERQATEAESSARPPRLDLTPVGGPAPEAWPDDLGLGEDVVEDLERIKRELSIRKSNP